MHSDPETIAAKQAFCFWAGRDGKVYMSLSASCSKTVEVRRPISTASVRQARAQLVDEVLADRNDRGAGQRAGSLRPAAEPGALKSFLYRARHISWSIVVVSFQIWLGLLLIFFA
jgi:hypothetical protein